MNMKLRHKIVKATVNWFTKPVSRFRIYNTIEIDMNKTNIHSTSRTNA